jgi:hypothetical protein
VFLFDHLPGGQWAVVVAVLVGWVVAHRTLKHKRRREQLRRRRAIRARLHAGELPFEPLNGVAPPEPPERVIDLREPAVEIDLRDRVVYRSDVTLESGETIETGVVMPFPAD